MLLPVVLLAAQLATPAGYSAKATIARVQLEASLARIPTLDPQVACLAKARPTQTLALLVPQVDCLVKMRPAPLAPQGLLELLVDYLARITLPT